MNRVSKSIRARDTIPSWFIADVCRRLEADKPVRRTLPGRGRLHIDRQLPFLCVYRRPSRGGVPGTERLVTSEASYLVASGAKSRHPELARLVGSIVKTLQAAFGAVLVVEIWAESWASEDVPIPAVPAAMKPRFRVLVPPSGGLDEVVATLEPALRRVKSHRRGATVDVEISERPWPRRLAPILPAALAADGSVHTIGVEVRPVFRNPRTEEAYPLVLRELRRGLTRAFRQAFHKFACTKTTHCPVHFHVLGRQSMVKAVWEADKRLSEVSDAFDFLMQVTPVNASKAWKRFRSGRFQRSPVFHYRPLPVDPPILKRRLFETRLERVEDPVVFQLLREKQDELDRRLTMLLDRNTRRFVHGSVQLFGGVSQELLRLAEELLEVLPSRARDDTKAGFLSVEGFRKRAEAEIARYREQWSGIKARVHVRSDLAGGLMVSRGALLISEGMRVPVSRADALLAHEVGTHVLTYYNGRAQPLRQLYSGLAGYEPLQEGLAVLAEYLVGGLSRPRLRLLAARVVAVHRMLNGATFIETFRELDRDYDFEQRAAFNVTMRVYRGGGLTKDAVYLQGLRQLMDYLAGGGSLEPLLVGKMAIGHVPIIRELLWRKVLRQPPLRPSYLDVPGAAEQLDRVRGGLTLPQLISRRRR